MEAKQKKTFDPIEIREDFPILNQTIHRERPLVYFDNGASTQHPRQVIEAMDDCYVRTYANVHRGIHWLSEQSSAQYEQARTAVRRFINASHSNEVIFTSGTTASINLIARSWGDANVKSGDEILLTMLEHHSNIVPWQMVAERTGAQIDVCPLTEDGQIDLGALEAILTPRTKLVSLAHVSNVLGSVLDARAAADLAHSVGAKLMLDGCQAAPRMTLDMAAIDCDFYAFSGHKIYGPTGIGVLWAREEILDGMPPWQGGGAMIDRVTFEKTTYAPPPQRFEAGTPMITEAIALHAAIEYIDDMGVDQAYDHERQLARTLREALSAHNSIRLFGPEESAGIVSFAMEGVHPHDLGTILDEEHVAIRAGHHCAQPLMDHLGVPATARASFGLYSDESDIAALLRGIERTQRIFG